MERARQFLPGSKRLTWVLATSTAFGVYIAARSWTATSLSGAADVPVAPVIGTMDARPVVKVTPEPSAAADLPAGPPAELFGVWTDRFHGTRTFQFHADGTGVMSLELDTLGRLVYGPKLEFDLAWTWSDGGLDLKMTGGRPEAKTRSAAAVFGDKFRYLLVEAGAETLKIKAADDGTEYVLERVSEVETANAEEPTTR